jgi:UDP-N-acetylglucosamine 4-epimerase
VSEFENLKEKLKNNKYTWLVTGCAGFIGSNLTEYLLSHGQGVVGLDNFSTGKRENLDDIKKVVGEKSWSQFRFIEGDVSDLNACLAATKEIDYVLHQAALGSVPRSIKDPITSHNSNVNGQLNMLWAAKENGVKNFVYASSSSVYGDHPALPKVEDQIGLQLSPYAVTKHVNELYGKVFKKSYDLNSIGIRYFNVFGKRQDPESIYAAVIPKWVKAMLNNDEVSIFGDGETSRDFCYIENVIQMNLLAAMTDNSEAYGEVFNCACHDRTDLNTLFGYVKEGLSKYQSSVSDIEINYKDFRPGDIRHSHANIDKANSLLGYKPTHMIGDGLRASLEWYFNNLK